ncbi:MAG: tRNA pseudouridine(55) synthase TruB [Deltaproteobacteria bacterium]|nr:tRNA pseudouridine(55) synthase TruB [Deltaproteobacteria bacterium]
MNGFLIIDKPSGWTSHDVVAKIRHLLSLKKVGHAGTLDPFATGVLPLCLGTATKRVSEITEGEKEYRGVLRLGLETETGDITGKVMKNFSPPEILFQTDIESVLDQFRGEIEQETPRYSAVKYKGRPLHEWARKGIETPVIKRVVKVSELKLESLEGNDLTFFVKCSKGTYIRSLLPDIAKALGTCGTVVALRRLRVGPFTLKDAVTLEQLNTHRVKRPSGETPLYNRFFFCYGSPR